MKNYRGIIAVFIAGILWGIIGLFIKPLNDIGFTQYEIIFTRALLTALIVLPIAKIKEKTIKINLKDLWIFIGMGCISFVLFNICYLNCIAQTGMGIAAVLLYTAPAFVMLFSAILFKEKITKQKILALALALLGCVFITGLIDNGIQNVSIPSILFGLGAGLGYSLYSIFGRYAIDRVSSLTATGWAFAFASIASGFLIDFKHFASILLQSGTSIVLLLGCALCCNVLTYILYTYGLTQMESSKASIIACIEPVVAFIAGAVVYHESVTITKIIGMLLVVSAVLLLNFAEKNMKKPKL